MNIITTAHQGTNMIRRSTDVDIITDNYSKMASPPKVIEIEGTNNIPAKDDERSTKRTKTNSSLHDVFQNRGTLFHILDFLPFKSARLFLGTASAALKQHHQNEYEKQITSLTLKSNNGVQNCLCVNVLNEKASRALTSPQSDSILTTLVLWKSLTSNLVTLDVGPFGSDELCYNLRLSECTLTLRSLSMVGSDQYLTDVGLWYLGAKQQQPSTTSSSSSSVVVSKTDVRREFRDLEQNHFMSPFQVLKDINITFCRKTTYGGTFFLRFGLPNLKQLRRQPHWLCGHFHTPFSDRNGHDLGNGGENNREDNEVEIHTYWIDGSFSFTRNEQRCGFVRDVWSWNKNESSTGYDDCTFVGDKIQYNVTNTENTLRQLAYRPGVSLLRLPKIVDPDDGTLQECVLVAQAVFGLRAPAKISWLEQCKDLVMIGESKYFHVGDNDDELVETRPPGDFPPGSYAERDYPVIIISKMKVKPLDTQDGMPPIEIIQQNYETCRKEFKIAEYLDDTERFLHELMLQR
jgi:hypothetical protein